MKEGIIGSFLSRRGKREPSPALPNSLQEEDINPYLQSLQVCDSQVTEPSNNIHFLRLKSHSLDSSSKLYWKVVLLTIR